jgi:hypothetical protein
MALPILQESIAADPNYIKEGRTNRVMGRLVIEWQTIMEDPIGISEGWP